MTREKQIEEDIARQIRSKLSQWAADSADLFEMADLNPQIYVTHVVAE